MHTRKLFTTVFCLIAVFAMPLLGQAQPGFDEGVDDVPIDGGLSLLVTAGVGYAFSKTRKQKQIRH